MSLFVQLTEWAAYMGTQLAVAEVDERHDLSVVERCRAISTSANSGGKTTVTAAKAQAYNDPEFLESTEKAATSHAYRKLVEALYNATDRKAQVLSRELTRRVGREPRENRRDRYTA
jgi:hypothetical protein